MVLNLKLVPEGAEDVGEQHEATDQRHARQPQEKQRERCGHLPDVPRAIFGTQMISQLIRVRDGSLDEPGRSPERAVAVLTKRQPPRVACRHADQPPHHDVHGRTHEPDRSDHRDHADSTITAQPHPDPERNDHQRYILFHHE